MTLLVLMNFAGATQQFRDSVACIPRVDLVAGLYRIDKLTVDSMRLDAEVKRLTQKLAINSNTILLLNGRIETYKELVAKYKLSEDNYDQRLKLAGGLVTSMKKEVKKATGRGLGIGVGGIVLTLLTVWLVHK